MNLNTHPENRKDMVKAISELTELPSAYMGMPSAAFQIGPITVNRDGTIDCEDETMIETIKPMLIEHGWLDAESEPEAIVSTSLSVVALEKFKSLFQQVVKPAKFGNVSPAGVLLDLGALFKSAGQFQQTVLD